MKKIIFNTFLLATMITLSLNAITTTSSNTVVQNDDKDKSKAPCGGKCASGKCGAGK